MFWNNTRFSSCQCDVNCYWWVVYRTLFVWAKDSRFRVAFPQDWACSVYIPQHRMFAKILYYIFKIQVLFFKDTKNKLEIIFCILYLPCCWSNEYKLYLWFIYCFFFFILKTTPFPCCILKTTLYFCHLLKVSIDFILPSEDNTVFLLPFELYHFLLHSKVLLSFEDINLFYFAFWRQQHFLVVFWG